VKRYAWMIAVALVATAGCGEEPGERVELGEQPQAAGEQQRPNGRASWPAELAAAVDSGNAAYADERYQESAEIFGRLTGEYPDIGVVYFGLYMAENALGNEEAAQAALAEAEARSPGLGRMHEAATDSTAHPPMPGMPMGHPPVAPGDTQQGPPLDMSGGR
jgi:tetratricopeptide (TPR) repeat protein